jgi:hypothetical protein
MSRSPQIYTITASLLNGLDLDQPSHVAQCRYAVAVTSRAAAVRALNAIGLHLNDSFMRDYGYPPQDPRPDTQVVANRPGEVFFQEMNHASKGWRPVKA